MRFWWVNRNQTFAQETARGYLWSPKRSKNGAHNPFYEFMREVAPGDLVVSLEGTRIRAIGVASVYLTEVPSGLMRHRAVDGGGRGGRLGWRTACMT